MKDIILFIYSRCSTTFLLTLFSQVMVDIQFPFIVYRKNEGFQIRSCGLFKLFPVSDKFVIKFRYRDREKKKITILHGLD